MGPFFVLAHADFRNTQYLGSSTSPDVSIALAQAGSLQIELIQQHDDEPSPYGGSSGVGATVHHLGMVSRDLDADLDRYAGRGVPTVFRGELGTARFAYLDTRPSIGCMTELVEPDPTMRGLFDTMNREAANWDGANPIRYVDPGRTP